MWVEDQILAEQMPDRAGDDAPPLALSVKDNPTIAEARLQVEDVIAATMTKYPSVETLFVDSGYAGQCAQTVSQCHGIKVDVVRHPAKKLK